MDDLIKELVEDFKKEKDRKYSKDNHEVTIVAKVNKKGDVEVLGVSGKEASILSVLCLIFEKTAKQSQFSAKELAKMCYKSLEFYEGLDD